MIDIDILNNFRVMKMTKKKREALEASTDNGAFFHGLLNDSCS